MSDAEKDPVRIGEILQDAGVFDADGSVNRLGVIGLFTGRHASEVDPLELRSNEELSGLVTDRNTPIEVVRKIGEIGRLRIQQEEPSDSSETELHDMSNEQLVELLRQKELPQEVLNQILTIARERSRQGNLPSEND